ncbi:MAG: hypothetical protein J0H26_14150, partial [Alphaproteobacteria bacterium]|nr:hypothetical protein [Alphaproteobacteria bacterium]
PLLLAALHVADVRAQAQPQPEATPHRPDSARETTRIPVTILGGAPFAQTLESLEQFRSLLRDRSPDADVMSLWWRFVHEFSLRARTEESAIMARMDQVPALKGRYANIIRDYEDELAAALSAEAGKDPETDLYARLRASVLLAAIVTGARWYVENFEQEAGVDAVIFTKMIMESFPAREKIQKEQRKFESKVRKRLPARPKCQSK